MFSMYGWMLGSRDERRFGCEPCLTSALAGFVVVVVAVFRSSLSLPIRVRRRSVSWSVLIVFHSVSVVFHCVSEFCCDSVCLAVVM